MGPKAAAVAIALTLFIGCDDTRPGVSAEEAKKILCLHVTGIPSAATPDHPDLDPIIEVLEVDRRLLVEAGDSDTAEVVEEAIAGLETRSRALKVSIFLLPDTTASERDAIAALLEDDPAVASFEYVSREQAYDEFVEQYEDQPEFFEDLPEDALPDSFRIDTVAGGEMDEFVAQFEGAPGIDDIRSETGLAQIGEQFRRLTELCGIDFP